VDEKDSHGSFDDADLVITLREAYVNPYLEVDVILHELLHAIWWDGGLEKGDDEERVVRVLATRLMQVWRDNPALIKFITGGLK
jgi:hypothetical protein